MNLLDYIDKVLIGLPSLDKLIGKIAGKLLGEQFAAACTDYWTEPCGRICKPVQGWTCQIRYTSPDVQCCSSYGGPKQCTTCNYTQHGCCNCTC